MIAARSFVVAILVVVAVVALAVGGGVYASSRPSADVELRVALENVEHAKRGEPMVEPAGANVAALVAGGAAAALCLAGVAVAARRRSTTP